MAVWARTQQLPGEARHQLLAVYGEHFPVEVRHHLASWIESKILNNIDPDNPQHEQYVSAVIEALIQELENKAATFTNDEHYLTKLKLQDTATIFKQKYSSNPGALYRIIRQCLEFELVIADRVENNSFAQSSAGQDNSFTHPDIARGILQQLDVLRQHTHQSGDMVRQIEQEYEAFALECHELNKLQSSITHLQTQPLTQQRQEYERQLKQRKEVSEQKLHRKLTDLANMKMSLAEKHAEIIQGAEVVQSRILDEELVRWKRDQQLAGNGFSFSGNLDIIQDWCESLAEIIWANRQQLKECERLKAKCPVAVPINSDRTPGLIVKATELLSILVRSTFVIERQPPQVMKTNTRFTATVRLLAGPKLNVHMTPPQVSVTIVSEAQANNLLKNDKLSKHDCSSGEILNNTGSMEYQKATRQLSVSFRNMQLRKIKRAEKRGSESVMDEKFSLLFQTKFSIGGGELTYQAWTLSLPVVVIVHGNQEPHAWATVTWDNAFADPHRAPFLVPDKIPWPQMAETLSVKFQSVAGRGLTEDNLRFLAAKAFRNPNVEDASNLLLSWSLFCKEPLPERSFTFWEWFYAIMKLTREHLRGPWTDNTIIGFVGRRQTEEMLGQCQRGTFLLRFSDSGMGGVTIAWIGDPGEVYMVQPFTSKDFAIRSLADRIFDLKNLLFLYPNVPKDQAFGKYYTPMTETQTVSNGYVKPLLVTQIPGWSFDSASLPATPNPAFYNMNSPASGASAVQSPAPGLLSVSRANRTYDSIPVAGHLDPELEWSVEELDNIEEFSVDISNYKSN